MHISATDRVKVGDYVHGDDPIGHPSCEGGSASGSHIHIARKYNGEWVLADGGLPFVLSGYQAHNGEKDCTGDRFCEGTLDNGVRIIVADSFGNSGTITYRPESFPNYFFTPTPKK
jgi:LasA protease